MNSAPLPVLAALVIESVLGFAVFLANPRRLSNQCFLLLSVVLAAWLGCLYLTFTARDPSVAAFYIRQAWATATVIVVSLNFLRLSVTKKQGGWPGILRDSWAWLALNAVVVCFCQTQLFLIGARIPAASMGLSPVSVQIYGPGFFLFVLYGVGALITLISNYVRDVRNSSGAEHAELAFISIGVISTLALSLVVAAILPLFIPRSQIVWFAPFRVILFSLVISYGIATRKIMEVGFFIRRAMSYFVLTAYLLALYGVTWWLVAVAFRPVLGSGTRSLAHVCAAIVVAFAMAPARGISQSLSDRLFVGTRRLDFRATMRKAADILKSVTTVRDLLERFAATTAEAMGTERVLIFMLDRNTYVQRYPASEADGGAPQLESD